MKVDSRWLSCSTSLFTLSCALAVFVSVPSVPASSWELLVVDYGDQTVRRYASNGTYLGVIASNGLSIPDGIAVDRYGNIYVGNTANSTVRRFSPSGQDLGVFVTTGLSEIRGLTFDTNGNLYVVNSGNNTVRRFSPDGVDLGVFASAGLATPTGIAIDTTGNVYVSNFGAGTVRKFSPAGLDLGNFVSDMPPQMEDMAFDSAGNLYVVSYGANLVRRYSPSGQNLGNFVTNFPQPESIVFTPDGDFLVSSYSSGFIRRYTTAGQDLGVFASSGNGLTKVNRIAVRSLPLPPPTPPAITSEPSSTNVFVGATAVFKVSVTGSSPLDFKWAHDGTLLTNVGRISGANSSVLVISNVQPADAGVYSLTVTNGLGTTHSMPAMLTVTSPACILPPAGIVGWWPGDSSAADVAGSAPSVLSNGVAFAAGKVSQAFSFNGSNSFVEVPDSPALRLTNELTVEFWVKRQQLAALDYIVEKGGDWTAGGQNYAVALHTPQFNHMLHFLFAGGYRGAGSIADLDWHHCAVVVRNGDADPLFVIDGLPQPVLHRGGPATIQLKYSTRPIHLGAQVDPLSGVNYFSKTLVDELAIYNRALSVAEIQAIYNAGADGKCKSAAPPACVTPPSDLAGWWSGDHTASDQTGNNNGTLNNNASFLTGKVGEAFNFNGVNQNVLIPDSPSLNPTNALTIEGWMYAYAYPPSWGWDLVSKDVDYGVRQYLVTIGPGPSLGSHYGFSGFVGVTNTGIHTFESLVGGTSVQLSNWYHFAVTYDGAALKVYVNGGLDGVKSVTGKLVVTPEPLRIGGGAGSGAPSGPPYYFPGMLDEVSLYSRALSAAEIQAIYNAGANGKCKSDQPKPPTITSQPQNRTVLAGGAAPFSVGVTGTPPFGYQWRFNGTILVNGGRFSGATSSQLVISNVLSSDAGAYSVVVSNSVNSVTSSNATLAVMPAPAVVRVVNTTRPSGGLVTVPITLTANGDENALSFTLTLGSQVSPPLLAFDSVEVGSDADGALLVVNTNQLASSRRIGIALAQPPGTVFSAGTKEILLVRFNSGLLTGLANRTIGLSFGSTPTLQQLSGPSGQLLTANYAEGLVTLTPSDVEADSQPRTNGNRVVDITDWVQVGRFVAKLDALPNGSEFQRVDCAPRDSQGNGRINVNDWVQAGRYAAGLDPWQVAGGPTKEEGIFVAGAGGVSIASARRDLRTLGASAHPGQTISVPVMLESQGDENALSFSLSFDPSVFSYAGLSWGTNGSGLSTNINTSQLAAGKLGLVAGLSAGKVFTAGQRELFQVKLLVLPSAKPGSYPIELGDLPVSRGISDPEAGELNSTYTAATVAVALPKLEINKSAQDITLSWPDTAGDFALQVLNDGALPGAGWTNVTGVLQTNNSAISITLPLSDQASFYRLNKP